MSTSKGEEKRRHSFMIGIKWKMLFIIVIFIVCSLISIWFFQVRMLNVFYQRTKFYELDASAEAIGIALENDEVDAGTERRQIFGELHKRSMFFIVLAA